MLSHLHIPMILFGPVDPNEKQTKNKRNKKYIQSCYRGGEGCSLAEVMIGGGVGVIFFKSFLVVANYLVSFL